MSTSGSYDFSATAAQVIAAAAENLGILGSGETINSNDESRLLYRLNIIAKEFGASDGSPGMKVHTRQRVTLFLAKGQQTYLVGPASTDSRATTQYGRTTLSASEAVSQTTLSVSAVKDAVTFPETTVSMTNGDIIGLQLGIGVIQWSTISGTPIGDTVTVVDPIGASAPAGSYLWWFTNRAQRFTVIESAVIRDANLTDRPVDVYVDARQYDQGVADKYADGSPTAILVEPLRLNTRVTLNTQPTDVTEQLRMTVLYPSEDYDATTNDIAFPQEWFGFLEWELTLRGCPMFGKTWTPEMERNYQNAKMRATTLNPENSVLYFQPG